jgi:hypothetical protein
MTPEMKMRKFIVITTIHPKSDGITRFEQKKDWQIIVVGDRKSFPIESSDNLTFLSIEDQQKLGYELIAQSPYDHYTRKNIGYLYAVQQGADVIYDTDDDNLPYSHWKLLPFACDKHIVSKQRFINIYRYFSHTLVWPRGYPLDEIQKLTEYEVISGDMSSIGVWQGLADLDPDVDAVYRLVLNQAVKFDDKPSVALPEGTYCPFNSQNTFWHKKAFPYLYLPATTSFRFTDILRGYVAQRLMWLQGLHLGFTSATVYQERNVHNLMRDFADEVQCYLDVKTIVSVLASLKLSLDPLENLELVYQILTKKEIIKKEELELCLAWINDYRRVVHSSG